MRHDGNTNDHQRRKEKTVKEITTIGLDLAKQVFHVVCCDRHGKVVSKRMLRRAQVRAYFANLTPCRVGMEACGGAHYWARELAALGHDVKLLPARFVKAFVRGNKNDYNDALAIAEAATRPEVRAVAIKSVAQQDVQALHRLRAHCVASRTALMNQLRGLLAEYGVVLPCGVSRLRRGLPALLEDGENGLSAGFRQLLAQGYRQLCDLDDHIRCYTEQLTLQAKQDEDCRRLQTIPGFGPIVASVFHAQVGDGRAYRRGRDVAASLGLVPRQHSSGGKPVLLGISKRGDRYLRGLLVHGARAVVRQAVGKDDRLSRWINRIRAQRGHNKAVVALANKLARIGWAVLAHRRDYQAA
jgi:transposase